MNANVRARRFALLSRASLRLARTGLPAVVLLACLTSACFSHTTARTAEPVEPGARQMSLGGGTLSGTRGGGTEHTSAPILHYQNRIGLSESMDLGLRLNGLGLAADLNYAFLQRESFVASIDPEVSFVANEPAGRQRLGSAASPQVANRFAARINVLADVLKIETFDLTLHLAPGWIVSTGPNFLEDDGLVAEAGASARYGLPGRMLQGALPFAFVAFDAVVPFGSPPKWRGAWGYSAVGGIGMKL